MNLGFIKDDICRQYIKGIYVGALLLSIIVLISILLNVFVFDGMNENANIKIILLFLKGFLLQGLYEEMIFRGYFMISIARKNSIFTAVFVNSVIFGFTYGLNNGFQALALLNMILFGTFKSIYLLKQKIFWGGVIHSMWNFIQGSIYGFIVSGMAQSQSVFTFKSNNYAILNEGTFGPEGECLLK